MSFFDNLGDRLAALGQDIVHWGILIIVALLILVVGRWILRFIRTWTERLLSSRPMDGLWDKSGLKQALEGTEQTPASLAAMVIYAYLVVGLWLVVARVLTLVTIVDLLERLLAWIPLVILAAVIVVISASVANWTANLIRPFAEERNVGWLTWVVRVGIIVFGALFALEVLRIQFAEDIVKLVVAALGIAFAIAFGVGGIDAGKKWWARFGTPKSPGASSNPMDGH